MGELSLNYISLPISYTMRDVLMYLNYNSKKGNNPKLYFFWTFQTFLILLVLEY